MEQLFNMQQVCESANNNLISPRFTFYVTRDLFGKVASKVFNETYTQSRDGIQFKTWVTE